MVDCLCHKHLFPHPLSLLRILGKFVIFILLTCFIWSSDLFDVNLTKEYKVGGYQSRKLVFVVTGWYRPYFHLLPFDISKQYREGEMSQVVIFFFDLSFICIFVLYLLFILWKSDEHNQPLFCLVPSCFFPRIFILRNLLNYLYFCSLRLESQKVYINSGLTPCIKTFVVENTIDDMGCVDQAKIIFHCICKNIEFIRIFKR